MDVDKKIYVLRMSLGFFGGVLVGFLKLTMEYMGIVILLATIIYITTIIIAYKWLVSRKIYDIKMIFLEGIGAYIFLWLFLWAVLYNLLVIYPPF